MKKISDNDEDKVVMYLPGTSIAAPMNPFLANSRVYLLVRDSISLAEYYLGLKPIPPFAPP